MISNRLMMLNPVHKPKVPPEMMRVSDFECKSGYIRNWNPFVMGVFIYIYSIFPKDSHTWKKRLIAPSLSFLLFFLHYSSMSKNIPILEIWSENETLFVFLILWMIWLDNWNLTIAMPFKFCLQISS